MDQAEIGSFNRYLLNRQARRFLEKFTGPPSCEISLKILRRLSLHTGNIAQYPTAWSVIAPFAFKNLIAPLATDSKFVSYALLPTAACIVKKAADRAMCAIDN